VQIALDWDGTFTACPATWVAFVTVARRNGHKVHIVTMRSPEEAIKLGSLHVDGIHYTSRKAKRAFMLARGINIDVWIDDVPEFIIGNAAPASLIENARTGLWSDM
jgi:hypothetical protein